ncbi:MAG: oligosaccharide flippase family protein [Paludibacter sp.]|nr:oligosaccharide flippase family protein [Paludibacter sp.]
MKDNKREIKDVVYLMALQGLNYVAPLIVFPYLMIVLGAEKFGVIGFSLSVNLYLMLLVDFGFNFSATKKIAQTKDSLVEINKIFSATLWAKIGLLIISFLILLIFAFLIPRFQIYSTTLLIMFLMVVANTFSFVWLFQGLGKIRIISIINIISKFLILPLTFIFVKTSNDYNTAAFIQSFVYILSSIITLGVLLNKKIIANWVSIKISEIKNELKAAYPIFLSNAATSIYTALFVIILGYYSTPVEVGKYAAVEKIMRGFCFLIFTPISQAFYPKISTMSVSSPKNALDLTKKILIFVIGIMIILFILLFFFSSPIMHFLGKDYEGTDTIFKIMSIAPLFIAAGGVLGQFGLLAIGNEKDKKNFQRTYFIAAFVALLTVFYFIPIYFSTGASIALLITEFTVFIGMLWFNRKNFFSFK